MARTPLFVHEYRITLWIKDSEQFLREVAQISHHTVAVAAWKEAMKVYPTDVVMLQSGIRVLKRSDRNEDRVGPCGSGMVGQGTEHSGLMRKLIAFLKLSLHCGVSTC